MDEAVQRVNQLLQEDRRRTVRAMSEELNISKSTLHSIMKKDMTLSKLCPKFVPKVLTQAQKDFRVRLCEMNLELLKENEDLLERIVTGDECWVSVFEIERKTESSQWLPKGTKVRPQKALRQRAERKTMLTLFADERGPIHIEFNIPGETINTDSYCNTLRMLKENVRCRCPELWTMTPQGYRRMMLHHDNAPSHTSAPTLALIGESHLDMINHPPYSPDLAPCDFFIFPRMKNGLRGHKFRNVADLQVAVRHTLRAIPPQDYSEAIRSMPIRWMKCISAQGEYFEGSHISVDPEDFDLEVVWDEGDSDQDDS